MSLKENFSTEAQANDLMRAVIKGELAQVLDMVVNRNIPADAADSDGNTALLDGGAKTGIRNNTGLDAFALASPQDSTEVLRIVSRQRGREIEEALGSGATTADVNAPAKASLRRKVPAP